MQTPVNHKESKERSSLIEEGEIERGSYEPRVHWRKLGVSSVEASHWLNCDRLSLAGLLLWGRGWWVSSSCWAGNVVSLTRYITSCWLCKVVRPEMAPAGLPSPRQGGGCPCTSSHASP